METETLETDKSERLLIYENSKEIERLNSEARSRCDLINVIAKHGLSLKEIIDATKSSSTIDDTIFKRQLKVNKVIAQQFNAGKKQQLLINEFSLPEDLERLKHSLLAWHNYNGTRDKLEFIINEKDNFEVDRQALEKHFLTRGIKVYLQGEKLEKYRRAEKLCDLLKYFNIPWNHLAQSSVLSQLLEINGQGIKPKWQYFANNKL